jgi:signal transduction histidine kinase
VDLAALAHEVAGRFADTGVPIRVEARGNTAGTWDGFRLDQVLTNLLSNAVKYGRGQPVDILVHGHASSVCCSVRDQGIGIDAGVQDRLFERFERAVPAEHFMGLGLGLWITRQIIEQHGGSIEVESVPDQGSTFTFLLPRTGP